MPYLYHIFFFLETDISRKSAQPLLRQDTGLATAYLSGVNKGLEFAALGVKLRTAYCCSDL